MMNRWMTPTRPVRRSLAALLVLGACAEAPPRTTVRPASEPLSRIAFGAQANNNTSPETVARNQRQQQIQLLQHLVQQLVGGVPPKLAT
jgi:hypothetical protein